MTVFTCVDCGIEVTGIVRPAHLPAPTLCLECRTIREAAPEDRPALRRAFHKDSPTAEEARKTPGHLGGLHLLPPSPLVCQECAVDHAADQPHNKQSLYYQYSFYARHGRWPTWTDAMAHCADEVRKLWSEELIAIGQELE